MTHSPIVSVSIHPAIGIARVGNSPEGWFLASDIRGGTPEDPDGYRDAEGRIKRQAARFRIYATHASGEVRELTLDEADIEWRVEVANLKSGWYEFHYALDLPVAGVQPPPRRNAQYGEADRDLLDIRPTARAISGRDISGLSHHFDDGTFFGKEVYLGEMRTDDKGRLLFLGGRGDSAPLVPGTAPTTFANNTNWHDDICDGPVRATVQIEGQTFEATPAHVVVTPPNFGPGLFGVVTMDDLLQDLYLREGMIAPPGKTSFSRDVWPIFDRMSGHQWVNEGFLPLVGSGAPLDARNPEVIGRLGDASAANGEYRQQVNALFRLPGEDRPDALPPFYGDAFGDRDASGGLLDPTRQELLLTDLQYAHLNNWAQGDFDPDWQGIPELPQFDALSAKEQTQELDRASMYECLGGPFHPGIEVTWPFRLAIMWDAPYRLRSLPEGTTVQQDYGKTLSVETALSPDGPHGASGAGSLTRWMGVPWQTDEASCNSGLIYSPELFLSSPSFWGARVPNQVLSQEAFALAISGHMSAQEADRQFANRHLWLRDINGRGYDERIKAMVSRWWKLGLVAAETPPPGSSLPDPSFVETGRISPAASDPTIELLTSVLALESHGTETTIKRVARARTEAKPEQKRAYKTFGRGEV